jgi:bifunctional DNA-binding transcriptional regulator/antitoxin component of YhaV-PrlF toxin-antitoxin module
MGRKSHITKATTTSNSLRTTIPEEVVKDMKLNEGDVLDWEVKTTEKEKLYAKVRKLE